MLPLGLLILTISTFAVPRTPPAPTDEETVIDPNDPGNQQCGVNEYFDSCAPQCPTQSCTLRPCDPIFGEDCRSECRCISGYLRDASGTCIPANECDSGVSEAIAPPSDTSDSSNDKPAGNPTASVITSTPTAAAPPRCPRRCKPTCAKPNPRNCQPNPACQSCQSGYIYPDTRNDTCIPIYQCPQNIGCNGDKNAIIQEYVIACQPTCRNPNQNQCNKLDLAIGCTCKSGYILSRSNGKCIPLRRCPGGNPCGRNQTFVSCTQCIFDSCPTGSLIRYPCDPTSPCPAGCICASGYNRYNGQCILSTDCPPVSPSELEAQF